MPPILDRPIHFLDEFCLLIGLLSNITPASDVILPPEKSLSTFFDWTPLYLIHFVVPISIGKSSFVWFCSPLFYRGFRRVKRIYRYFFLLFYEISGLGSEFIHAARKAFDKGTTRVVTFSHDAAGQRERIQNAGDKVLGGRRRGRHHQTGPADGGTDADWAQIGRTDPDVDWRDFPGSRGPAGRRAGCPGSGPAPPLWPASFLTQAFSSPPR